MHQGNPVLNTNINLCRTLSNSDHSQRCNYLKPFPPWIVTAVIHRRRFHEEAFVQMNNCSHDVVHIMTNSLLGLNESEANYTRFCVVSQCAKEHRHLLLHTNIPLVNQTTPITEYATQTAECIAIHPEIVYAVNVGEGSKAVHMSNLRRHLVCHAIRDTIPSIAVMVRTSIIASHQAVNHIQHCEAVLLMVSDNVLDHQDRDFHLLTPFCLPSSILLNGSA